MILHKSLNFIFFSLILQTTFVQANPIMMPENCLQNQKAPCLVKFKKNEVLDYKNIHFMAPQESVLKITEFKKMNLGLNHGRLIIKFVKPEASLQVSELIFRKGPMYLERHADRTIIINGENYKRIEISDAPSGPTVKTSVMDNFAFIEHLSKYYSNKEQLKTVLRQIFPVYLATHKKEVEQQKQQLQRSIASVEYREEQERIKQAEIKAQQKKNRDLFFQRTFKQ